MNPPKGVVVDHINGDSLDCRRANMRICTNVENVRNSRKRSDNTSGYKGVSIDKETRLKKRWRAYINYKGKRMCLGRHMTKEDAAKAYNVAAKKYFGEFARLNVIPQ